VEADVDNGVGIGRALHIDATHECAADALPEQKPEYSPGDRVQAPHEPVALLGFQVLVFQLHPVDRTEDGDCEGRNDEHRHPWQR